MLLIFWREPREAHCLMECMILFDKHKIKKKDDKVPLYTFKTELRDSLSPGVKKRSFTLSAVTQCTYGNLRKGATVGGDIEETDYSRHS